MIYPDLEQILNLDKNFEKITCYKEIFADTVTPVTLLNKFYQAEYLFMLESVENDKTFSRFSFFGKNPDRIIYAYKDKIIIIENGNIKELQTDIITYFKSNYKKHSHFYDCSNFGDFGGGYVGFFGYETVNFMNILRQNIKIDNEIVAAFMLINDFYVFDNFKNKLYAATSVDVTENIENAYKYAIEKLDKIENELFSSNSSAQLTASHRNLAIKEEYKKEEFINKVKNIKEEIVNGEAIQVVLSQKFTIEAKINPVSFYRALRNINPSPYMFYLKFKDFVITGASPETHLKIKNGKATLKPIAGTYSIGKDIEKIKNALLNDEKELAEHLMLLDLARNDLYTGCEIESVKVTKSFTTEVYSHVIHIVSEVTGKLKKSTSPLQLFASTFPAGTVTGAPKVRAIELINDYEDSTRGFYAGCVGYLGYNHNIDTCITIRSAYIDNEKCILRAGAGIVYDSVPENEYEEVRRKLKAMFKAVKLISEIEVLNVFAN